MGWVSSSQSSPLANPSQLSWGFNYTGNLFLKNFCIWLSEGQTQQVNSSVPYIYNLSLQDESWADIPSWDTQSLQSTNSPRLPKTQTGLLWPEAGWPFAPNFPLLLFQYHDVSFILYLVFSFLLSLHLHFSFSFSLSCTYNPLSSRSNTMCAGSVHSLFHVYFKQHKLLRVQLVYKHFLYTLEQSEFLVWNTSMTHMANNHKARVTILDSTVSWKFLRFWVARPSIPVLGTYHCLKYLGWWYCVFLLCILPRLVHLPILTRDKTSFIFAN